MINLLLKPYRILPMVAPVFLALVFLCSIVYAAIPAVIIQAEQGSLSGQVQVVGDAGASAGSAIAYGNSGSGITLPSPGTWTNATGNLANAQSECGNLTIISGVPNSSNVIAGVAARGLWQSSGGNWSQLGTGSGSATIVNRPSRIVYDPNNTQTFWESGIYNGGGIYKTTDGGQTFQRLGDISHNDFVSVDFTDPNRQTLLAGGHEQSHTVWKSTNGGQTWTNIGANLPNDTSFSSAPIIINATTYVVNSQASWGAGSSGIYRTTNGGTSWTKVSSAVNSGTPLVTSGGVIYFPNGQWQIDGLHRSSDGGQAWTTLASGINSTPVELPDGRLVAVRGNNLAVSADSGQSWTNFGASLPYFPAGVAYSSGQNAFYIWKWDCGGTVMPDAIMKLQ